MTTRVTNVKRDEEQPTEGATPETTAEAKTEVVASDEFPVQGRIAVRGDGGPQASYNLLVLSTESVFALEALKAEYPDMEFTDNQGQPWMQVTIDPAGKAKLRQAARQGATKLVVEGIVTVVDLVNGKPQGFMRVTSARAATLKDGGRVIQRESREAAPVASMPALSLRRQARA
jgi:hypothetical protein